MLLINSHRVLLAKISCQNFFQFYIIIEFFINNNYIIILRTVIISLNNQILLSGTSIFIVLFVKMYDMQTFQRFVSAMKPHRQHVQYRKRMTRAVTHRFIFQYYRCACVRKIISIIVK